MGENSGNTSSKDSRKLTNAEIRRKENFGKIEKDLLEKGYKRVDLTVSLMKANTVGVLMTLPLMAAVTIAYMIYNHGLRDEVRVLPWPLYMDGFAFFLITILMVVIHEGIHGLSWSLGTPHHLKDIEFGFVVKMLTPYCTCKVPISIPLYVFGSLMPMTLLGIIPGIVCIFFGSSLLLAIFIIQILAGAGDLLISCMVIRHMCRTKCKDVVLIDHPHDCGAVIFEK